MEEARVKLLTAIAERRQAEKELGACREQLSALAAQMQSVRERERARIARELHDEIGQRLTAIKISLETGMRGATDLFHDLAQAVTSVNELIARVRDFSLELRPAMLDDLGLLPALKWHFDRYTVRTNVRVDFRQTGLDGRRFAPEIETAVYRIVQEALTNVARHAGVGKVEVEVYSDPSLLRLRIKDLGCGFKVGLTSAAPTAGLASMRDRVTALGGRLDIQSAPGTGTRVDAELSLQARVALRDKATPLDP